MVSAMVGMLLSGAPVTMARSETLPPSAVDPTKVTSCQTRPLPLDMARLRSIKQVQSVVVDSSASVATLLFANGDVLRIGTMGCVSALLSARLWVADRAFITDATWIEKARFVTGLVLEPDQARQISDSLETPNMVRLLEGAMSIEGKVAGRTRYSMTVSARPTDNLGSSMSIVYFRP
jgi:hypothetical protein